MARIKENIVYGNSNNDKLTEIVNLFCLDETEWDSLCLEPFDELDEDAANLKGYRSKQFFLCSTNAIKHFRKDIISSKNLIYKTYLNNIAKEGLITNKTCVLLKSSRARIAVNEVFATKILNFFGCATPYNFLINAKTNEYYVGSVDFISEHEYFIPLSDLKLVWTLDLNAMIKQIDCLHKSKFENHIFSKANDENIAKLKEDIVRSFLVRTTLLKDADHDAINCGILYNKKNNSIEYIDFDLEASLSYTSAYTIKKEINTIIHYTMHEYPKIYKSFIDNVKEIKTVLDEIEIKSKNKHINNNLSTLNENINYLISYHKEVINEIGDDNFLNIS